MKHILVTGGTGFIGSHTVLELLNQNYRVTAIDNLSNSKLEPLKRVEKISGKRAQFRKIDLLDIKALDDLFASTNFDSVIHFAGLKAVGESVEHPLRYYKNNISGTVNLCEVMSKAGVKNIVFSSSATVYGDPEISPIIEESPLQAVNPYGRTKLTIEYILQELYHADDAWNVSLLRYFNPVGAHESGEIGEDPNGIPNNLMPYITQVAIGKLQELSIFGGDYPTHDGTAIRDYIHVCDLADGHIKALENLDNNPGVAIYNLGTGKGSSVLDVVKAFEKANKLKIPYNITTRREGDAAICYANVTKANNNLNWKTNRNLENMCRDAWNWQQKNPDGYP
ncbi:MAG: UDP-glucose 4-epimerase GalE [Balneolaceae bacterium]|jgi:UDP-glucose 4-epimerase|nr:MAG: UDP-glucose 4-epimerase GalE [Balneolaceae bacterium]